MDDKDIAVNILKQQRNQALDALADVVVQATKQAQQIDALEARCKILELEQGAAKGGTE